MEIFIDESGNLGKDGRYFIIAMIIPYKKKRIKNFIKSFCSKKRIQEIKGALLNFTEKQSLINKLSKVDDYSVSYIIADLKHIKSERFIKDKNLCFNYLFMLLLRRTVKNSNEDINILLDNHNTKVGSINSLKEYIQIKAFYEWGFKHNLDIKYMNSKETKLIQMADLIANIIYQSYTYNKNHFYKQINIAESIKFPFDKFGK